MSNQLKTYHVAIRIETTMTPEALVEHLLKGLSAPKEYTPMNDGTLTVVNRKKAVAFYQFGSHRQDGIHELNWKPLPVMVDALNAKVTTASIEGGE